MHNGMVRADNGRMVWLMEVAIGVKRPAVSWWQLAVKGRKRVTPKPKWRSLGCDACGNQRSLYKITSDGLGFCFPCCKKAERRGVNGLR